MCNNNLSEYHKEIVKRPFVFISYCWDNPDIKNRVKELVNNLRNNRIPVLYDEEGLEPGENSRHFEAQILNENCKLVFVVSDPYYAKKIQASLGGSNDEFNLIITDYNDNPLKYIPLKAGTDIPLFKGKIYYSFEDNKEFDNITTFCHKKIESKSTSKKKTTAKETKRKIDELYESADKLYDKGDYKAALRKLNKADELCKTVKYTKQRIKILHRKLNIYIKESNGNKAVEVSNILESIIPKGCNALNKARFYGNFALAHRLNDHNSLEYERYARMAYSYSKELDNLLEKEYYARLYKSALLETEQYCDAYEKALESYNLFQTVYPVFEDYSIEQFTEYFELICDLAEAALYCSKDKKNKKEKLDMLSCSEIHLWEATGYISKIDDDAKKAEAYRIFSLISAELHNYYSS